MKTSGYIYLGCSLFSVASVAMFAAGCAEKEQELPNIIVIYTDDQGYGDYGAYGATELKTPNLDKLAHGGVRFTSGYATSATCTPSRYALLTGEYPWRNESARILPGSAPLIIDTTKMTIPGMLKEKGTTPVLWASGTLDWALAMWTGTSVYPPGPMKWDLIILSLWQLPRIVLPQSILKTDLW
jgi:hypothetical protein